MMAGRAGAVAAARRAHMNPIPRERVSDERLAHFDKEMKEIRMLEQTFKRYDTNKSGKLEKDSMKRLLTDFDNTTPPGTEPSEEELMFIIKLCDDRCSNGSIDRSELKQAIISWRNYTKMRESMQEALEKHDASKSGTLNKEELKAYLTTLNKGLPVEDTEVDAVMAKADVLGNGVITTPELMMATCQWYTLVDEKKAISCCTVS